MLHVCVQIKYAPTASNEKSMTEPHEGPPNPGKICQYLDHTMVALHKNGGFLDALRGELGQKYMQFCTQAMRLLGCVAIIKQFL
jgi:hypothetical protein